jgi:expansin (peptidoglycan-binding protein)
LPVLRGRRIFAFVSRHHRSPARAAAVGFLALVLTRTALADGVPGCPAVFEDATAVATFYDADGTGHCGYDVAPDRMVVAVSSADWAGSVHCGRCLQVWGPEGMVIVRVVDSCPTCGADHIDLSAEAFDLVADPQQGIVPVAYRSIACPVAGPVAVKQKEGSNPWWLALQPRNHRHAIAAVSVRENGATNWQPTSRQDYGYFLIESGAPAGLDPPLDVRITDVHGRVVIENDLIPVISAGTTRTGTAQLAACAGIFVDGFESSTLAPWWSQATP